MKFFKNKKNIFLTLFVGVLIALGVSYTNCGSEMMSNFDGVTESNPNEPASNTNDLKNETSCITLKGRTGCSGKDQEGCQKDKCCIWQKVMGGYSCKENYM